MELKSIKIVIVAIACQLLCVAGASAQVAVIANKSVPEDTIRKTQLLDFYTGDIKKWDDKTPVVVFDLKPNSEAKKTFYEFLGKNPARMKSIWLKKLLSGEGDPPQSLNTEEEILKKVAATPGGLGFVSSSKVSKDVKTLCIIEKEQKD